MKRFFNKPAAGRVRRIVRLARGDDPMAIAREAAKLGGADMDGLDAPTAPGAPRFRGGARPGAQVRPGPGAKARAKRRGGAPDLPAGARWEWREHAGPHGARRFRLYVPSAAPSGARPLVLMLHGCTQDADDFARGTRMGALAERHGLLLAFPEQPREANPMGCWNWFEPAHQQRGGEPGILAGIVDQVAREEAVDASRVFAAGLSAGGAMAATLAATHPGTFAAVCVHSGLPHGAAGDAASAFAVMRRGAVPAVRRRTDGPRLLVLHGAADTTVAPANADALLAGMAGERRRRVENGAEVATVHATDGATRAESWRIPGLGHAWSGGDPRGSYAEAAGPDASAEMVRFFLEAGAR